VALQSLEHVVYRVVYRDREDLDNDDLLYIMSKIAPCCRSFEYDSSPADVEYMDHLASMERLVDVAVRAEFNDDARYSNREHIHEFVCNVLPNLTSAASVSISFCCYGDQRKDETSKNFIAAVQHELYEDYLIEDIMTTCLSDLPAVKRFTLEVDASMIGIDDDGDFVIPADIGDTVNGVLRIIQTAMEHNTRGVPITLIVNACDKEDAELLRGLSTALVTVVGQN